MKKSSLMGAIGLDDINWILLVVEAIKERNRRDPRTRGFILEDLEALVGSRMPRIQNLDRLQTSLQDDPTGMEVFLDSILPGLCLLVN